MAIHEMIGRDRRRRGMLFGTVLLLVCFLVVSVAGQQAPGEKDRQVDAKWRAAVVDSVAAVLDSIYVFPDTARSMIKHIRGKLKGKDYDEITSAGQFAQQLTGDLREVFPDGHLHVSYYSPEDIARYQRDSLTEDQKQEILREAQRENFGFKKAEILTGNVGYLDFRYFGDADKAGATAVAALNFLAYVDALIVDLRQNGGGSPSQIQLMCSYFFEEPVHLNSFYIRSQDSIQQFWTQSNVQGPRMTDVDIYVLTSSRTYSGAEEFTYNMKNLKRGTIIGETTGGGAHPTRSFPFMSLGIVASVPFGRAINPISGTNWEQTGVEPDIAVPADEALEVAHHEALKKLREKETDEDILADIDWALSDLDSKLNPVVLDMATMQEYVGGYGPRAIMMEGGKLIYQRVERPKFEMIPMEEKDLFRFDDLDYFRLKFERDSAGAITAVVGKYRGGHTDRNERGE